VCDCDTRIIDLAIAEGRIGLEQRGVAERALESAPEPMTAILASSRPDPIRAAQNRYVAEVDDEAERERIARTFAIPVDEVL
jgi:hypothetical protein